MTTGWIIFAVFFYAFIAIVLSYVYYDYKTGVPTFPTMPGMRKAILDRIRIEVAQRRSTRTCAASPVFTVLDMGSGSGQMTHFLARSLPEVRVIGVEISFIPWLRAVCRKLCGGPVNLSYERRDFWGYDCSHADVVIVYLLWKVLDRMSEKLLHELRPGTLVLANTFPLKEPWQAEEVESIPAPLVAALSGKTNLYLYRKT